MKYNQKGFSFISVMFLVLILALLSVLGWFIYDRQKNHSNKDINNLETNQKTQKQETTNDSKSTYSFNELGISMDINDGWQVISSKTQENKNNFYEWTVQKAGADGKIELRSFNSQRGWPGCDRNSSLTSVTIRDIAPTKNDKLLFMSWSYKLEDTNYIYTGIVPAAAEVFYLKNDISTKKVPFKNLKVGDYFFCLGEPGPETSLKLNNEETLYASREDTIRAISSSSTDNSFPFLPKDAKLYEEIKAMLISIK